MINSITEWNIKEIKHKIILSHQLSALDFDIDDNLRQELIVLGREKTGSIYKRIFRKKLIFIVGF